MAPICPTCGKEFHRLGIARHRTMHADRYNAKLKETAIAMGMNGTAEDNPIDRILDAEAVERSEDPLTQSF